MEGASKHAPVIAYVSRHLPDSPFMLVDIGCEGGINPVWRQFGPRLRAFALDPNAAEIERLQRDETHAGVTYLAGLASIPDDHPFACSRNGRDYWGRNPWDRLSAVRSTELRKEPEREPEPEPGSAPEMTEADDVSLVPPADQRIVVPRYCEEQGITSVDFVKIDVDGADFEILNSFDTALDGLSVLGLSIEVNFFGTDSATDHTFHNIDRFMKARGFELFDLTVRRYSMASLPGKELRDLPFATEFGRPLQGDALYVRDLASAEYSAMAAGLPVPKLANLVCLFAAFDLPDCAAEVAIRFRDRLAAVCDVEGMLDLLAEQAQWPTDAPLTYREYIHRFESQERARAFARSDGDDYSPAAEIHALRQQLAEATSRAAAMETSKFWRLRRHWFRVKRLVGLGGNE